MKDSFDVVVVGGGMVGTTCAALFARDGLEVALIDSGPFATWDSESFHPRVSAINLASREIFRALGVWSKIADKRANPYLGMTVWEHDSSASIRFDCRDLGRSQLGFIIENDAITSSLVEKLDQNYNVTLRPDCRLQSITFDDSSIRLSLASGNTINCDLLVGADGARSQVRQAAGIDTTFSDFEQDAIVTTVALAGSHEATAWQSFSTTGPAALLPLADGNCSVVWSCDRTFADDIMNYDQARFCEALGARFSERTGEVTHCSERTRFPLQQHHAHSYIGPRVALIGDAAHVTHPLAGLGANIGLLDAAALAETTLDARRRGHSLSRLSVLRRYERWRKGDNELVLAAMKSFKNTFGSSHPLLTGLRRAGLDVADAVTPFKAQAAGFAMGVTGDLPRICRPGA